MSRVAVVLSAVLFAACNVAAPTVREQALDVPLPIVAIPIAFPLCPAHSTLDASGLCTCDAPYIEKGFIGITNQPICELPCGDVAVLANQRCVCPEGKYDDGTASGIPNCQACPPGISCAQGTTVLDVAGSCSPHSHLAGGKCACDSGYLLAGFYGLQPRCVPDCGDLALLDGGRCVCPVGFYDPLATGPDGAPLVVPQCTTCPTGAVCGQGSTIETITAAPGYFRPDPSSPSFSRCLNSYFCQ